MSTEWVKNIKGLLIDISGVIHEAGTERSISGSVKAIGKLKEANVPFILLTNETSIHLKSLVNLLNKIGFDIKAEQIQAPSPETCKFLQVHNLRPLLLIRPETLPDFHGLDQNNPNAVVIGDAAQGFTYDALNNAFRILINNPESHFITMGRSRYYQENGQLIMDLGGYVAGLEYATDRQAKTIGKPDKEYFALALSKLGLEGTQVAMIGDDIVSDVGGAQNAGIRGILVRNGKYRVERDENHPKIKPDMICNSLLDFVNMVL